MTTTTREQAITSLANGVAKMVSFVLSEFKDDEQAVALLAAFSSGEARLSVTVTFPHFGAIGVVRRMEAPDEPIVLFRVVLPDDETAQDGQLH